MHKLWTLVRSLLGAFALAALCGAVSLERHEAGTRKAGRYAGSGFFSGGDKTVSSARLKDIRRGPQGSGAERIVFDLDPLPGNKDAVPFFQVNINPEENRVLVSVWADVTYDIDRERIARAFAKSSRVKAVNVLPRVEAGLATVELVLASRLKNNIRVEAFYLTHPSRIILDLL